MSVSAQSTLKLLSLFFDGPSNRSHRERKREKGGKGPVTRRRDVGIWICEEKGASTKQERRIFFFWSKVPPAAPTAWAGILGEGRDEGIRE